jgi:hypothetical protein
MWDAVNALVPWVLGALMSFSVWLTAEVYACKYTMLTEEDGRRIKAEAVSLTADKLDHLILEVQHLNEKVGELQKSQAETLVEIRHLKETR